MEALLRVQEMTAHTQVILGRGERPVAAQGARLRASFSLAKRELADHAHRQVCSLTEKLQENRDRMVTETSPKTRTQCAGGCVSLYMGVCNCVGVFPSAKNSGQIFKFPVGRGGSHL